MVVHHAGAGTTLAAARAGVPQVAVPLFGDRFHWAGRVRELGIGTSVTTRPLTVEALATALHDVLRPPVTARARAVAARIDPDGAGNAARRLVADHA